jgi:hypothetical protein
MLTDSFSKTTVSEQMRGGNNAEKVKIYRVGRLWSVGPSKRF